MKSLRRHQSFTEIYVFILFLSAKSYYMSGNAPNPEIETIEKVVDLPLEKVEEQGVVIVHCRFDGEGAIRIWKSTFLIDSGSNHRSRLLHAENITMYPYWTHVSNGGHTFTLYFEALPGGCNAFDLMEVIPQEGGFLVQGIVRNTTDVYKVEIL